MDNDISSNLMKNIRKRIDYSKLIITAIQNNNLTYLKVILHYASQTILNKSIINASYIDQIIKDCLDIIFNDLFWKDDVMNSNTDSSNKSSTSTTTTLNEDNYILYITNIIMLVMVSCYQFTDNIIKNQSSTTQKLYSIVYNKICPNQEIKAKQANNFQQDILQQQQSSFKPSDMKKAENIPKQLLLYDIIIFQQLYLLMKENELLMYQNESLKYYLKALHSQTQPSLFVNLVLHLFDNFNDLYTQIIAIPTQILFKYISLSEMINVEQYTSQCYSSPEINIIISNAIVLHYTSRYSSSLLSSTSTINNNELSENLQIFLISIFNKNKALSTLIEQHLNNNNNNNGNNTSEIINNEILSVSYGQILSNSILLNDVSVVNVLLQIPIDIMLKYIQKVNQYIHLSLSSAIRLQHINQIFFLSLIATTIASHFTFINIHSFIEQIETIQQQILDDKIKVNDFAYNLYEYLGNTIESDYVFSATIKQINRQIQIETVCDYLWPKLKNNTNKSVENINHINQSMKNYIDNQSKQELFVKLFGICINEIRDDQLCDTFVSINKQILIKYITISQQTLLKFISNNVNETNNMKEIVKNLLKITLEKIAETSLSEINKTLQRKLFTEDLAPMYNEYAKMLINDLKNKTE